MPRKPKKPCAYPDCPNLTDTRYCPQHHKLMNRHYNKYQRGSGSNQRYSTAWRRISAAYRKANPLCELCETKGQLVPATFVHHKVAVKDGGSDDESNLQSLCRACHEYVHRHDRWNKT